MGNFLGKKFSTSAKGMDVKQLRKKAKVSQQLLAEKTNIPRDRIAKWEQGKGAPKADDLKKLEEYFGNYNWEDIPNVLNDISANYSSGNYDSVVRTLEYLAQDKIRSTALMERLTVLLESKFSSNRELKVDFQTSDPTATPAATERGKFGGNTLVVNTNQKPKSEREDNG
jgi:transcriptional regulator with XRE-family HTH domain